MNIITFKKSFFSLIELVVVIVVLGILASIILINVNGFRQEAHVSALQSNIKNLQTGIDMMALEEGAEKEYPSLIAPTFNLPQPLEGDILVPKYSKTKPETENAFYWIDVSKQVWGSSIDSPTGVKRNNDTISWESVPKAEKYQIYEVTGLTDIVYYKPVVELNGDTTTYTSADEIKEGTHYVVGTIDQFGLLSAPVGEGYDGHPKANKEVANEEPVIQPYREHKTLSPVQSQNAIEELIKEPFNKVALGFHSMGLYKGEVYTWGNNGKGELGLGDLVDRFTPTKVKHLEGKNIVQLFGADQVSFALTDEGDLYAWGSGQYGKLGLGSTTDYNTPQLVNFFTELRESTGEYIVNFETGWHHSFIETSAGRIFTWGNNSQGQLGLGVSTSYISTPTELSILSEINNIEGYKIKEISAGGSHTLVLLESGDLYGSGYSYFGQLSMGEYDAFNYKILTYIMSDENIADIEAAWNHSLLLWENGSENYVYTTGWNSDGQLGLGDSGSGTEAHVFTETPELANQNVVQLFGGNSISGALTKDGRVFVWGNNENGEGGTGDKVDNLVPTEITFFSDKEIVEIKTGKLHLIAVTKNGDYYTWGSNGNGRLGDGTEIDRYNPILIDLSVKK